MRLLLLLIAALLILSSEFAKAADCKRHKIYCAIVGLQPSIDKTFAMQLSNMIFKKSKKYGVNPLVSLAILNQESSLRNINTFSVDTHVEQHCDSTGCSKVVTQEHEVVDMTIAQINVRTAVGYGFDIERLFKLQDLDYALECHYIILKDKIQQCASLGDEAWSCYHSATPKHRLKYVEMVKRFL